MNWPADLRAPDHVREQLVRHAEKSYPDEACGALLGTRASVVHAEPLANRSSDPTESYSVDPAELDVLSRRAAAEGMDVIGFYHSHPDTGPLPSRRDLEAAWPGYLYINVSVRNGVAMGLNAWRIEADG